MHQNESDVPHNEALDRLVLGDELGRGHAVHALHVAAALFVPSMVPALDSHDRSELFSKLIQLLAPREALAATPLVVDGDWTLGDESQRGYSTIASGVDASRHSREGTTGLIERHIAVGGWVGFNTLLGPETDACNGLTSCGLEHVRQAMDNEWTLCVCVGMHCKLKQDLFIVQWLETSSCASW